MIIGASEKKRDTEVTPGRGTWSKITSSVFRTGETNLIGSQAKSPGHLSQREGGNKGFQTSQTQSHGQNAGTNVVGEGVKPKNLGGVKKYFTMLSVHEAHR